MLTIIHGDNTAQSRNYYLEERTKNPEKIILDGTTLTLTEFLQATSNGLFGDQKTIFIEELLSKRKTSKELDSIQAAIINNQSSIILWESKELTSKQLSPFKNSTIKVFKIPQAVFAFLDSLMPDSYKKSISLFHELLKNEDVNFAFFMLQRQVRILLAIQSVIPDSDQISMDSRLHGNGNVISEVKRMAPWQKGKLQKQAKSFSQYRLLNLHEKLYQLELSQKTGQLSQPLDQAVDFLLLSI